MDFDQVALILNKLLSRKRPESFNSSWILKQAPACYRFIQQNIRTDSGSIDWDRVTAVLESKYQRRWMLGCRRRQCGQYRNADEVERVLTKHRDKLYVFISLVDENDRLFRDTISIPMVRIAQKGNFLAKQQLIELVGFTIDGWLDEYSLLSRWRGYHEELQVQLADCIHRYRYTGSFICYVFRTLEYAARGLRPLFACLLDEPLLNSNRRRVDKIV